MWHCLKKTCFGLCYKACFRNADLEWIFWSGRCAACVRALEVKLSCHEWRHFDNCYLNTFRQVTKKWVSSLLEDWLVLLKRIAVGEKTPPIWFCKQTCISRALAFISPFLMDGWQLPHCPANPAVDEKQTDGKMEIDVPLVPEYFLFLGHLVNLCEKCTSTRTKISSRVSLAVTSVNSW